MATSLTDTMRREDSVSRVKLLAGRMGQKDEITSAAIFLCSDLSRNLKLRIYIGVSDE